MKSKVNLREYLQKGSKGKPKAGKALPMRMEKGEMKEHMGGKKGCK